MIITRHDFDRFLDAVQLAPGLVRLYADGTCEAHGMLYPSLIEALAGFKIGETIHILMGSTRRRP